MLSLSNLGCVLPLETAHYGILQGLRTYSLRAESSESLLVEPVS